LGETDTHHKDGDSNSPKAIDCDTLERATIRSADRKPEGKYDQPKNADDRK
jgi:hypothetical protein